MAKNQTANYISNPFKLVFNGLNDLFKHNQTLAIIILVLSLGGTFWRFGGGGLDTTTQSGGNELSGIVVAALVVVILLAIPIGIFIGTVYSGLLSYVAYQTSQSRTVGLGDALHTVIKKFWTILWIHVVVALKVLGGLLLLIVPGIRAALRYNFVLFPVFAENANASSALKISKNLTKDHLIEVFGMVVAAGIIPIIGPLLIVGGQSIMYPQLKSLKASDGAKPPVHWLNYLGILLAILFMLFIGSIVALVTALSK